MFQTILLAVFLGPFAMNTVFFPFIKMTGHYRLPRISSTPSCASIASRTSVRTTYI